MIRDIVGVDVASKELVCYNEQFQWKTVANAKASIAAFLRGLTKDTVVALEATGGYGHLLASMAHKRGHLVYMLMPSKVKDFCKSSPSRGKSDKHDARDIASYVVNFESRLHPYSPLPAFEAKLKKLYRKREAITDHLASLRLMLKALGDSKSQIDSTLKKLKERVEKLSKEINEMLVQADDAQVLFSIPGVKANLIAAVLPALRSIPFKSKYALDSYAGIDLKMNESGKFKGRRYISHEGDSHIRRAVYLAGLSGITCKAWKPYYRNLIDDKKLKPIQAINALGRKMLHTLFGVYKTQTEFLAPSGA